MAPLGPSIPVGIGIVPEHRCTPARPLCRRRMLVAALGTPLPGPAPVLMALLCPYSGQLHVGSGEHKVGFRTCSGSNSSAHADGFLAPGTSPPLLPLS